MIEERSAMSKELTYPLAGVEALETFEEPISGVQYIICLEDATERLDTLPGTLPCALP